MLRSLTFRLALTYFAASLCVILVVAVGVSYVVIHGLRDDGEATIDAVHSHVLALVRDELKKGKPMSAAARSAWSRAGVGPMYKIIAYDSKNITHAAYDSAPYRADSVLTNVLYVYVVGGDLYRSAHLKQGVFFIDLGENFLTFRLISGIRRLLPFVAVAVVLAALLSWLVARLATSPLRDLAADLRSFGRGDLAAKDLSYRHGVEIDALYASYNDAVENAKRALSERAAASDNVRTFISDASHELRTPLTIVMGYIDALAEGLVTSAEDSRQILRKTLNECRRMRDTIEKLLSLARLERGEPDIGTVDVASTVRDVAESMQSLAPQLKVEAPVNGEAMAVGNADEIREALITVVDNAVKYGKGAPIDISVSRKANVIVLEVADLGPGMSKEERERAFDRFYRGNAAAGVNGSGLGLAVAKRAVERANGRITLNSELGRGTAVTFYLLGAPSID